MTRKIIAAATAAILLVSATSPEAKPLKIAGGCSTFYQVPVPNTPQYADFFQTFKPTFSLLKSVSLALWGDSVITPLATDVTFTLSLWSGTIEGGTLGTVLASATEVLPAGSEKVEAESGYTVIFTFAGGVPVSPGVTYTLQLEQVDNTATPTHVCTAYQAYVDGAFFEGMTQQGDYDFEFKATGTGRAK